MKKTPIKIATETGFVEVNGWAEAAVPGLVAAKSPQPEAWPGQSKCPWTVYHHQGKRVAGPYRKREAAGSAILALANMTDWALDESTLRPLYTMSDVYQHLHPTSKGA